MSLQWNEDNISQTLIDFVKLTNFFDHDKKIVNLYKSEYKEIHMMSTKTMNGSKKSSKVAGLHLIDLWSDTKNPFLLLLVLFTVSRRLSSKGMNKVTETK